MSIGGDPGWNPLSHSSGREKERFSRGLILSLTELDIHQVPVPINGPIQVDPTSFHLEIRLVAIPTRSDSPAAMFAQGLTQHGSPLGFPLSDCFMGKHDTAVQEHFCKIAEAEFVTYAPEYYEADNIGRVLQTIKV